MNVPIEKYPIEYFTTARDELMFRVKQRDSFLIMHLLVQGVLLALSYGVKLGGAEAVGPMPQTLHLAVPLAVVFSLLYYTEDRLIGQLSSYLGSLPSRCISKEVVVNVEKSRNEEKTEEEKIVPCWDVSSQLQKYAKTTVLYRFFSHLIAFFVTPTVLLVLFYNSNIPTSCLECFWLFSQIFLLVVILIVSVIEFIYRRKTGQKNEIG